MTREEALLQLRSNSTHNRLKAARFLAHNCNPSDLQALGDALSGETVSYVRAALGRAIKRVSDSASPGVEEAPDETEIPPDVRAQIRSQATKEVSRQLLHEIASPIGLVASAATREIPTYESSRTKKHVNTLKRVFEAIEQLSVATTIPKPEEFDLAEWLAELVAEATGGDSVAVSRHGAKPLLITSDPALLRLAVLNGLRNAVEAVAGAPEDEAHSIIVTWGETDVDYWVTVLDRGPGVTGPVESAFGIGKSTKKGHSGFGLAIARQAIETLGGQCTLRPATSGGAQFEVRWER